jgi:hypothetical protein
LRENWHFSFAFKVLDLPHKCSSPVEIGRYRNRDVGYARGTSRQDKDSASEVHLWFRRFTAQRQRQHRLPSWEVSSTGSLLFSSFSAACRSDRASLAGSFIAFGLTKLLVA